MFPKFCTCASRPRRGIPSSPVSSGFAGFETTPGVTFQIPPQSKKSGQIGAQKLSTIKYFKNNNNTSFISIYISTNTACSRSAKHGVTPWLARERCCYSPIPSSGVPPPPPPNVSGGTRAASRACSASAAASLRSSSAISSSESSM